MQLTEQHVIDRSDPRYSVIDATAFASKNLYNAALYEMRQSFIHQGVYLNYTEINKRKAELQKQLGHTGTTQRMERMTNKRNRRINHYMHTVSKRIIDLLVKEGIGTLCIGKNDGWKQDANMGKRTTQNFVQIPHARFIPMLTYKAELVGITVKLTEESYTSKASFLDLDPLPVRKPKDETKHTFSGKRVKPGLYRASNGREINADINGAANIIRKVAPDAFQQAEGVEDGKGVLASLVVHPVRIVIPRTKPQKPGNH